MRYTGTNKSSAEIAAELGVNYIIEGSVIKIGQLVKISVRLIDAVSDKYKWAQGYERDFKDILSLQGDVARAIAKEIQVNLTPGEETYLSKKDIINPEAYEDYLKGKFYWFKLTPQALDISLQYFESAARLDPDFALAYAGIALVWMGRAQMGYTPMHIAAGMAQSAVDKALELDDSLAEVHYANAGFYAWSKWDWEQAQSSFEKAIRLNPNFAEARAYYSHLLFTLGRPEEGIEQMNQALKLDPFNTLLKGLYGMTLNFRHRYDEAIESLKNALQVSPGEPILLSTLRTVYHQKHMYPEALEIWRLSLEAGGDQRTITLLDSGFAAGGYSTALRCVAEAKIKLSGSSFVSPWPIATLYTRAGMADEALAWLEKALMAHDPNMPYLKIDPIFDYLRENPRFKALISEMGL